MARRLVVVPAGASIDLSWQLDGGQVTSLGSDELPWRLLPVQPDDADAFIVTADAAAADGYIGSARCGACHATELTAWQGSHHDLAMQPANADTVLGDFKDAVFEHRGVRTRFFRRADRYRVETQGADGAQREYEIAYTFGVTPLQQYLIGFPDGRYQARGPEYKKLPGGKTGITSNFPP